MADVQERPGQQPQRDERAALARRRRMAEVFGEVLPETTSDERSRQRDGDSERWYRENRPPHHGG